MPDWTYRPLIRPVLFRLPPDRARTWALGALSWLARLPFGPALVDFFGHLRADPRLQMTVAGQSLPSPVGIGCPLDPGGLALGALARFGVGYIEVGAVGASATGRLQALDAAGEQFTALPAPLSAEQLANRLQRWGKLPVPVWVRLAPGPPAELRRTIALLRPHAGGFIVEADPESDPGAAIATVLQTAPGLPVWLAASEAGEFPILAAHWTRAADVGATGLWLGHDWVTSTGSRAWGKAGLSRVVEQVRQFRETFGPSPVVAASGAHSPLDAKVLRDAGAQLVVLDTGLVFTGPGLAKRVNEVLLARMAPAPPGPAIPAEAPSRAWFWFLLMGLGMVGGGLLALTIALTRVVLPYDEVFCGMNRAQLEALNSRLLAFMAHDRVTLAGTMLSAGILYSLVAWQGLRTGHHWAKMTVAVSATSGFLSFFLFLGFGYFDPFHAFVTAILFQFLLLGLHSPVGPAPLPAHPSWLNSPAWRRGQWGQLLFVTLGMGLVAAGVVICGVGVSRVFVATDLDFLRTTAGALQAANPRLVPLVAHDRAALGGMLVACGLAVWLAAQWGIRGGERWLWWTFLGAGFPAFAGAIGIHLAVGYTHWEHLAPALAGLAWFVAALILSHAWLTNSEPEPGPLATR